MNRRVPWSAGLLLALVPALGGCSILSFVVEKTFSVVTPPPRTQPACSLAGKSVLILVDAAAAEMADQQPQLTNRVALALARELDAKRAAAAIINPQDLAVYAQRDPDYSRKTVVEIGRDFKVDLVVDVIVQSYVLTKATAGDTFSGYAAVALRVVDVKRSRQLWPDMNQLHLLEVSSPAGITSESPPQAEKILLEGLARKVGMVFAAYDLESLPLNPQVK